MKRSMDREGFPVSKRPRSGYPAGHDITTARLILTDFSRRDNHRQDEPLDYPPPPPVFIPDGNRPEFRVHDRPGLPPLLPPRPYDTRGPPPVGPYPLLPRLTSENDYRSLCINGIPSKVPNQVLRECLFDNYKRFGKMYVRITFLKEQRVAFLNFRYAEDAREAFVKGVKYLFDSELKMNLVLDRRHQNHSPSCSFPSRRVSRLPPEQFYHSRHSPPRRDRQYLALNKSQYSGKDDYNIDASKSGHFIVGADRKNKTFPCHLDHVDPEYDDKATRTLFVGNLDVSISVDDLHTIFGRFGLVECVNVKRPAGRTANCYAFIKYINLDCAYEAKVEMSGKYIGKFQCRIGYSKVTPTPIIWVGNIGPWVTVETLKREFDRFGAIQQIEWPRNKNFAYVIYDSIDAARAACQQMRGFPLGGTDKRLRLDFVEKDDITHSHSLPDYPPPKDSYGPPERAPEPRRDIPRLSESTGGQRNCRAPPPPEPCHDEGRRTDDYAYDRSADTHREPKPLNISQRSPERGRDYGDERGQSREFRDDRDQSRDENRHSDVREYRAASPHEDYISTHCRSLADLSKMLPVAWNGALILKNSAFATRMHVVSGDVKLVDTLMRDPTPTECPVLKLTRRLRLDQPNLDDVSRCLEAAGSGGHCILLAMQSSLPNYEENLKSIQQRPLNHLVTYLKQKDAAAVISLPPVTISGEKDVGILHAFPPCDFGFNFLKSRASKLPPESTKEDHLVIVVIKRAS
ncbi:hypothetical protein BsWGS_13560 [Bradybaena similaris]